MIPLCCAWRCTGLLGDGVLDEAGATITAMTLPLHHISGRINVAPVDPEADEGCSLPRPMEMPVFDGRGIGVASVGDGGVPDRRGP